MKAQFLVSLVVTNTFNSSSITEADIKQFIEDGLQQRGLSAVTWYPDDGNVGDYDDLTVEPLGTSHEQNATKTC